METLDKEVAKERLASIEGLIAKAATDSNRRKGDIRLLAVGKTHPASFIRTYYDLGLREFGENYVQELEAKFGELPQDIEWHVIGNIQSNKTAPVARMASWVHTVDRLKIAQRLNDQRPQELPPLNVLIEVNVSSEAQKHGVEPSEVGALADAVAELPRLRLRGLMCVAENADESVVDSQFARMKGLFDALAIRMEGVDTLSMGMTQDMAIAIRNGSTMVRIGTALFGKRDYGNKP